MEGPLEATAKIRAKRQPRDSPELAQESPRRHRHRVLNAKTIGGLKGQAHHHLKGVNGPGCGLKVAQRRRKALLRELHLDEEPGLAVAHHEKIHFAF